jgi:S1-C subfamily serine protease
MKRCAVHPLLVMAALLLAACVSTTSVAPLSQQEIQRPSFLRGFTEISNAEEPAVGRILGANGALIGSGVLVSPTHVLTAYHVVDVEREYVFEANSKQYRVAHKHVHPMSKVADSILVDLAILELSEPCTESPVSLGSVALRRGEPLTVVGHGGGYRKRSNTDVFFYYGTLIEDPIYLKMLCYEGTIWFGDSGGAVLDFQGKLVGIVSSLGLRPGYIYENSAVHVDLFKPWITTVIEGKPCDSPAFKDSLQAP